MSEFASNVNERVREAQSALDHARAEGDDYLVGVHTGQLESLARLAEENDVALPAAEVEAERATR
ncbi:hypothetical protein [uncultured Pseudokineococcus sp.]|uniref:hypothetical protein n=1 Tax=uncultured Pseudokineococcus sp. TaxID=1642928 RepID=UPI00261F8B35|nr:hypothetical protein [uncultured Pseudokineococcus sp.]